MDCPTRYAGVDWASRGHAVCIVDERGSATSGSRSSTASQACGRSGGGSPRRGSRVAIERPDGPVIDALFAAGLEVVVIASRHVKAIRTRYGTAGNKDDRADAYILADVLRTDGHRLRPLRPDSPETVTLRATVRARKDLVQTRVRLVQQLRPTSSSCTREPSGCSGTSTRRSPCASWSGSRRRRRPPAHPRRIAAWLRARGTPVDQPRGAVPAPRGSTARADRSRGRGAGGGDARLRPPLLAVRGQVAELEARIAEQLELHPDGVISEPAAGRPGPGGGPAGRDRRCPGAVPDARVVPASPGRRRRPASRGSTARSRSGSPATRSSAMP